MTWDVAPILVPLQIGVCQDCYWHSDARTATDIGQRVLDKMTHQDATGHEVVWEDAE